MTEAGRTILQIGVDDCVKFTLGGQLCNEGGFLCRRSMGVVEGDRMEVEIKDYNTIANSYSVTYTIRSHLRLLQTRDDHNSDCHCEE